ncbi:hypothetical protein XHC_3823 [Xanthomonas hortorum pv. carotae str. M081]|nr:hypothetical protein XHC_3823 [Xanthomonas hortorum pv. carotae str. M081]
MRVKGPCMAAGFGLPGCAGFCVVAQSVRLPCRSGLQRPQPRRLTGRATSP